MGTSKELLMEQQRRESLQEAYDFAATIHPLEELGQAQAWDFVEHLVNEFGHVPDTCCCCTRKSAQGAHELDTTNRLWLEAVKATVRDS